MKTCENCSSLHDGSYGSGRFCSSICAKSFSTKNKRAEINEKVSLKLTKDPIEKICPNCGKKFKTKNKRKIFCGRSCQSKFTWKDEEHKIAMGKIASKRAIKRHREGDPTIGWKMRKNREASYPEKTFMFLMDELKIEYEREYKVGKYFIDFVFKNKIALEIDGQRHNDEDIKLKDAVRETYISQCGWKTFRIKWKTPSDARAQLIEFLKNAGLV